MDRNALDSAGEPPLLGGDPPSQWSWEFQKPLFMDFLRNALQTAPLALPGRAPASALRAQDLALRPLTAAELEMAEVYRRILNPPPIKGLPPRKPAEAPQPQKLQSDPPSFYEMWARQGKKD